ncbi:hypothetical protein HPB50_003333 [Hyalomma asiaticum]|uniref:Uncharacterized protein n=1 Tax=Hyalomma asiaticum TaxID=266040 RepID=A0ACB7S7G8_HYAAI|nr:hypothetical protein HPB50_003333 [Hyalomma asiaticum]
MAYTASLRKNAPSQVPLSGSNGSGGLNLFPIVSGLASKCSVEQVYALIYFRGDKAEDILASLNLTDEQNNNQNDVLKAFENHFVVRKNVVYDRAAFLRIEQREGQGVEDFVTELHQLSKLCSFG